MDLRIRKTAGPCLFKSPGLSTLPNADLRMSGVADPGRTEQVLAGHCD